MFHQEASVETIKLWVDVNTENDTIAIVNSTSAPSAILHVNFFIKYVPRPKLEIFVMKTLWQKVKSLRKICINFVLVFKSFICQQKQIQLGDLPSVKLCCSAIRYRWHLQHLSKNTLEEFGNEVQDRCGTTVGNIISITSFENRRNVADFPLSGVVVYNNQRGIKNKTQDGERVGKIHIWLWVLEGYLHRHKIPLMSNWIRVSSEIWRRGKCHGLISNC